MFPVMLNVEGQACLVVGGGGVAARRVNSLLGEGARVTVIAVEAVPAVKRLAADGEITLHQRPYRPGEATAYTLVFAATDQREVNQQVFEDARGAGIWVNVADDPPFCTFHVPARVRRPPLEIAIASGGDAPFVTRRLRQLLERKFGHEWAEWIDAAARFRESVRSSAASVADKEVAYDRFFDGTVDTRKLTARVPTPEEMAEWVPSDAAKPRRRRSAERADAMAAAERGRAPGLVSLIGAGPGDAGLLSLRARQRLMAADVVAYDRLAATALPCDLPAHVELHAVGKKAGNHPVPQEEITALIVRLALSGKRVVRLKGGDPYVFGRGREEAAELRAAGVPFEVIPAVTSGVAVPAYAGIPVTSRGEAVRLTLVTAHEAVKGDGPQVRWDLLAADPHATLVGYMGVTALPGVVEQLLAGGMDPTTPAAMIARGTTSRQHTVRAPIAELPAAIVAAGLRPPALFVIGPAVRHAETLDWFGQRPLHGERIGAFTGLDPELAELLELGGVELLSVPMPVTRAARVVMGALPLTGWLLRDPAEVEAIDDERDGRGFSPHVVAWCLGKPAAERARALGWQQVEELAAEPSPAELVAAIQRRHRT